MKIDFLIDSLSGGGAERVMTTLANGFGKRVEKVSLITFNENDFYHVDENINRIKLHHGILKNHTLRSFINLFAYYFKKNNRPDVLIAFMPRTNLIAIIVARIFRIKLIISEHTNHLAKTTTDTIWIRKKLYKYANATTVLTHFDLPFYKAHDVKALIMPNPIILPKKIRNFKKRSKNILVAGSLNRYKTKGFDSLLFLIEPVLKKNIDWTLTIAGAGETGMDALKQIVDQLNLHEQVLFTGFCKDMQSLMQESQIFVLVSKFEGLPMALMEALSNGMCCIAYDCVSGPSDLIINRENGLLIKDQNEKEMQLAIGELIDDEDLRLKLASNSPSSVEKYSLENILERWTKLIHEVIN